MKLKTLGLFAAWAAAITIVVAFVHVTAQQTLRQGANDPQIQTAEDLAAALSGGDTIQSIGFASTTVDMAESLTPFIMVLDDAGNVIKSSGHLNGVPPVPPKGVLDYVRTKGEERVTWQPREDVRIAAVVVRVTGQNPGFVVAGRSLREVELRESMLVIQSIFAWLLLLIIPAAMVIFFKRKTKNV